MDRRSMLKHTGVAGILTAGVAPAVHAQPAIRWRLASSFPKSLDTLFGSAEVFSKTLKALTGGKFEVSVHAAGELMPAFGVVDGVQNGTVEMTQTAPYYFTGKDATFALGSAVPFGLTLRQMNAWIQQGNGGKLLGDFFAGYNMLYWSGDGTGTQMGGWYRKEIKSLADLKGLKFRLGGGLFGDVAARLGVVPQNMPAGDVYQALEKGTLDAAEWIGPHDDEKLGFNKVAKFYYYPGWWEANAQLAWFVNKTAFETLPPEYKAALRSACGEAGSYLITRYDALNPAALKRLVASGTQLRSFPKDVMEQGFAATMEVMADIESRNPVFKKIHQDMRAFQRDQLLWERYSELRFNSFMTGVKI